MKHRTTKWLKNLPIQKKISLAILTTCASALAVAAVAIFFVQLFTFRQSFTRDLEALASILANNSTAAVSFKDRKSAEEILRALEAKPHIVLAEIDLPDNPEFAMFHSENRSLVPDIPKPDGFHYLRGYLALNRPLLLAGERIGTLRLVSDYHTQYRRSFRIYAVILGSVLGASVLLALTLARRLQRLITTPILSLAATAKSVAEQKNFSLRATKTAEDEVGWLTDAFNEMLAKTQSADAALRQANDQLGLEIVEHKKAEDALQVSERFMRSLVESLPLNILRKDMSGRFTFANQHFCRSIGKPMHEVIGKTDFDLFPPELASKYRKDDEKVLASEKQFETEEQNKDQAGNTIFVQVIKTPLFDRENRAIGLQVIFWDVSERKQAEQAVEKLNKQLLLTSRQAGMAEVATGVLHNVGNVLNSVNVSANLMEGRLRQSRIQNVGKALALIRDHRQDLARFLTEDPKGKILPGYLETLTEHLAAEQEEMLREMAHLSRNVEHIKEIVAMQQNYAKLCGVTEKIQVADLVEDAIRMNLGAFERHGITIVREFAAVPPVLVDRHKVLQILVNLMRNAKYAMDELGPPEKKLSVAISLGQEGRVVVSVRDNGIGIAPENITRIFGHGFTTKRDGHGFGLHSGALAAKDMGGQLTCQSAGPGQGATFLLELPVASVADRESRAHPSGTPDPALKS